MSLCFVLLFLSACSNQKTYYFKGESENWLVKYIINITGDNSESGDIAIKYIGNHEKPKEIHYEITGGSGSISGNRQLHEGALETSGSSCSGCAVTEEHEVLDVTLEWDGKSDSFVLKTD